MRRPILFALLVLGTPAAADPPGQSPAQHDARVARTIADNASRRVLGLLGQSRVAGNRLHERCIDGALSQINSFGRLIEERHRRLSEAEGRGEVQLVAHERQVIRRLAVQVKELERQAVRCVHPEVASDGDTRTIVVVTIDPDVPSEDVGAYLGRSR